MNHAFTSWRLLSQCHILRKACLTVRLAPSDLAVSWHDLTLQGFVRPYRGDSVFLSVKSLCTTSNIVAVVTVVLPAAWDACAS